MSRIPSRAFDGAVAAQCAGRQSRFWEMHDRLFVRPRNLALADPLADPAIDLQMNRREFETCRRSEEAASEVERDRGEARHLKILHAPTFFVGILQPDRRLKVVRVVVGTLDIHTLESLIAATRQRPN